MVGIRSGHAALKGTIERVELGGLSAGWKSLLLIAMSIRMVVW